MPEWLLKEEKYTPPTERDTFINKSILTILSILAKIQARSQYNPQKYSVNATLKVAFTLLFVIFVSLSQKIEFVIIGNVYALAVLSFMSVENIVRILKVCFFVSIFTIIILLPSMLSGNNFTIVIITSKVFASVMAMNILSYSTKWSDITNSLKVFFIPNIFIFVLDITVKYIVILGDFSLNMFYSLKLRSVGRNKRKYNSLSGIAGTMFIKSKEMAEDMYTAMECRGFTGEYGINRKNKFTIIDLLYATINILVLLTFVPFGT